VNVLWDMVIEVYYFRRSVFGILPIFGGALRFNKFRGPRLVAFDRGVLDRFRRVQLRRQSSSRATMRPNSLDGP